MFENVNWDALRRPGGTATDDNGRTLTHAYFSPRERDSYGEAYEGEGECYLIFEVDGKFFKKHGYESSYDSDVDWTAYWLPGVSEVKPKTVITTVFE